MLQETFNALERSFAENSDGCIDCAKSIVEVVCQIIIDELDSPESPVRPPESLPSFGNWVSAAVRVLKLGDNRNLRFQKLVSQHRKLTDALGDLRNEAGPISHGRDGFLEKLSVHHRRAAVLSADAIVTFLHQAYLEAELDLVLTREPYERLSHLNGLIDACVSM
jgi:Abortive infection C-terminus